MLFEKKMPNYQTIQFFFLVFVCLFFFCVYVVYMCK